MTMDSRPTLTSRYLPSTKSPSRATTTPPFRLSATTFPGRVGSSTNPMNFTGMGGSGGGPTGRGGGAGVGGGGTYAGVGGRGGAGGVPNPKGFLAAVPCSGTCSSAASWTGSGNPPPDCAPRPPAVAAGTVTAAGGFDAGSASSVAAPPDCVYQTTSATRTNSPSSINCRRCSAGLEAASFTGRPPSSWDASNTSRPARPLPGIPWRLAAGHSAPTSRSRPQRTARMFPGDTGSDGSPRIHP